MYFSSKRLILLATLVGLTFASPTDGVLTLTLTSADDRGVVSHDEDVCELKTTELDEVSDGEDDEEDDVVALNVFYI